MEKLTVRASAGRTVGLILALLCASQGVSTAQDTAAVRFVNDSVSVRFVEMDIRAVIQAIGQYLPKPVLIGPIQPVRVTLVTPGPVDRATLRSLLRGLLESQNLEFVEDSSFYRIGPRQQPEPRAARQVRSDSGPVQLFVIRLRHARAADVAATVNQLFGGTGPFSGQDGGLSTGTLSEELRRNVVPPAGASPQSGQPSVRQSTLAGSVTIVPDELTNSLLVRASQDDFDVIKEAVEQLDIRPLQVLIEVLIVEARHDRSFSLGADLFVPPQSVDKGDGTAGGQTHGGGLGDLVITLMNLGRANIDATIRAAASRGDVEIISRPVLLASNNQEARFLVGSQRPFVQVSRSLPTDSPQRDQVIQYRDVGTKLIVRPTINQDGYVSLLIQQEINQATSEVQF
ncbi:MAG TPA: secretin N-terminal domain-containing protein, partial [Gemmatimonadales bacterium]|nr:secretin N-terminal domain-containing protein [Gemmatimonadales bacterium]